MNIKKALLLMILFMIGLIWVNVGCAMGEETSGKAGVSLSPAYMDLGSIEEGTRTFTVSVVNEGKPVRLKAKIDNAEGINISVSPDTFRLSENEHKDITITITEDGSMRIGAYDLSIAFITQADNKQSITAHGTNSLRLVFRKEGLALATCNVKDIPPIQKSPFYSILSNFYVKSKRTEVNIIIKNKATSEIILQQNEIIKMKSYPDTGFYGEIDTPVPQTPWEYGDYIYQLTARIKNTVALEYVTEFNVGERKGKLEYVSTKNVFKGEPAEFNALIKNVGTQKLPVDVRIEVKDKRNHQIFKDQKTETILPSDPGKLQFKWPTKYSKIGRYSIDYQVIMGDQKETGTLYYKVMIPWFIWMLVFSFFILITIILIFILTRKCRWICRRID